ncbi:32186d07-b847-4645-a01a-09db6c925614 [Thermothielavioides terrestris]|nr:32186d07-b847-4645-a01a-09db6c925614 [Thermothielavioides terrestris]
MASTASALTLYNFQPITSAAVPLSCILAYNSRIPGCKMDDFVKGNTCSAACVGGLTRVQSTLQAVCSDADVPPTSVLGQALLGNLVQLLCPGTGTSPDDSTSSSASVTVTITRTSSRSALILTTVSSTATTTAAATQTEEPDTSTTSPSTTTATPDTLSQTFIQSPAPTSVLATTSTTTSAPEQTSESPRRGGGGSPFDPVVLHNDSAALTARWVTAALVSLGLCLLLLH